MTTNNSITAVINQNKKLTPVRVEQVSAASLGFSNIDNTRDLDKPISNLTQAALDLKANIASPTFTGTVSGITQSMVGLDQVTNESKTTMFTDSTLTGIPTAPTADSPTNTTQIATTAFVQTRVTTKINELIGDAGTTLDSLGELADALNDSPAIITNLKAQVNAHEARTDNPHSVTRAQLSLDTPDNVKFNTIEGTLVTAAQTNITSVGTLTDLTVAGDLTVDTDTLYIDSTNNRVGIGTLTPATTLDVDGVTTINGGGNVNDTALEVTGGNISGELDGPVLFKAKAGEPLEKGEAVYISGISGNTPVVHKALATDANKMPAFGLAHSTVGNNQAVEIVTFGTLSNINTTGFTSLGTTLYISGSIAGQLTTTKPSTESGLIQNIGKVQRFHSASGSIKVGGAGRSNDVPNLNAGNIFIGGSDSRTTTQSFATLDVNANQLTGTISEARIPSTITRDTELAAHTSLTNNPHSVTKAQLGLNYVENKSSATIRSEIVDSDIPATITRDTELAAHTSRTNNPHSVTKAQVGLGEVTNESKSTMFSSAELTGNPTAPTQVATDDSTKIATTQYVTRAVAAIVDSAPGSLNTLNELAAALNNSPNQIDNILAAVGQRLVIGNNLSDLNNAATARTNLGLGNVEDTALSTFAGTTNITTLGTITTGTWNGTAIDSPYVGNLPASKINSGVFSSPRLPGLAASDITTGVFSSPRLPGLAAADITTGVFSSPRLPGLAAADITTGTFADARIASSNVTQHSGDITTLGTISTGVWQGTAIANAYVADLPTSKITSGTFADARIASSNVTQHSDDITSVGTLTGLTTSGTVNVGSSPAYSETRAVKVFDDGTANAARVSLIGTGDSGNPALEFVTDGSLSKRTLIRHEADNTTGDYSLNFFTTTGGVAAQKFRIAGSGNVGINTGSDSPASKLHVVQSGHSHLHGIKLERPDNSNTWSIWQNASSTLFFQNASTATGSHTTRLWLNTSGKLNVSGDLAVGGTILPAGQIDFGERAADDVLIKGESDNNNITLIRGASNADTVGVSVKYLGSASGEENMFQIATDGGGSFKMDQSGDCAINQSPAAGVDLTLGTLNVFDSAVNGAVFQVGRSASEALKVQVDDTNIKLTATQDSDSNGAHSISINRAFGGTGANDFKIQKGGTDQVVVNTDGNISAIGTITSTSSVAKPVQSDETDDSPINTIRRLTQAQYDALTPDANTFYIIV